MSLPNIVLLSSTQGEISVTGSPKRASGSSRSVGSLYTVVITAMNLTGRVYIEGTLASNPGEQDWFAIPMPGLETPYVAFPNDLTDIEEGIQNVGFNFKGNLVWLRARLDRDYLNLPDDISPQALATYGYVDEIVLNSGSWVVDNGLPVQDSTGVGVTSVGGNNLGDGVRIYSNSTGQANVLLNFKTLVAGDNIDLTVDSSTITISAADSESSNSFLDLDEAPNSIGNSLMAGLNGNLVFISPPSNPNQYLRWNGTTYVWTDVSDAVTPNLIVKEGGTTVTSTGMTLNFGTEFDVVDVAGVPTVNLSPTASSAEREYVFFQYTAGGSGNLSAGDVIISKSSGVTVTIVDAVNCVVEFRFTGRSFPPSSIALMGQAQQSNDFNYSNVNPSLGTRKIAGGGTAANPTLLGSFAGPITLQLRMSDIAASAPVGQRAKGIVMFNF